MIGWKKVRIYDSFGYRTTRSALLKLDITGEVVRPDVKGAMKIPELAWFVIRLPFIWVALYVALYVMRDVPMWQSIPLYIAIWFLGLLEGRDMMNNR